MNSISIVQGTDSTPVVARVYADPFTDGVVSTQPSGDIGALDETLNSAGTLPGSFSVDAQLSGGTAQAIQVLSDGTFIVAMSKSITPSNIGKYDAQGTLQTASFGSGTGIASLGASTEVARTMMIDTQGRILVAGGATSGSAGWLKRVSSDGSGTPLSFVTGASWQTMYAIAEQSSGKVITAGFNGTNAQIGRYALDGTLDMTFGTPATPGFIILDGSVSGSLTLPTVSNALVSIVVDAQNLIYVAYSDASGAAAHIARFTAVGLLDATFGTNGIANIAYLNGMISSNSIYLAIDLNNNLIAAGQVGNNILVTAIASLTGGAASPAFTNVTISTISYVNTIQNLITTSDGTNGKILINGSYYVSSGSPIPYNQVVRLTNTGLLDNITNDPNDAFNTTGYNQFRVGTPDSIATLLGAGLSPDGQLYVVGYQRNGATNTGYVYRLYNDFNTYQVSQSPATQEQGTIDVNFGSTTQETNPGIVTPFNGLYRTALQQKAQDVIELTSGNILVAMDGYTNSSASSSMMLLRFLPTGVFDGAFGTAGQLTLPMLGGATEEHINSIFEDGSANIYVAGYSNLGGIFRKYTSEGVLIWNADSNITGAGYQGLGIGLQGSNRVLLFGQTDSTTGQISAYDVTSGALDTSFNSTSGHAGYIYATDYTASLATVLHMGPVYDGSINDSGATYIAYKNSATNIVSAASIFNAGPGLDPDFGASGIVQDVFGGGITTIPTTNVHSAFATDAHLIVVGSVGTSIYIALLDSSTGDYISTFNSGAPLQITDVSWTAVMLNSVIGISDGSIVITGYDNGTDDTMLVVRVTSEGILDPTFNSQGTTPGILTIQIGNQLTDFSARVATGITVQSHVGVNQGNLIVSGYEQEFSSVSTPMMMRVFGTPGTTQVKSSPSVVTVPGDFDPSYGTAGLATTYANGASSPTSNQQVKAIAELVGMNIMTAISDTINSWTTQLLSDSTLDTSYGAGGSALIAKGNGDSVAEYLNGMVFDGDGNMLVYGSNELLGGYVKRILISGAMDTTFGGYTGDPTTISYPVGTAYGLMSTVNGIGQLSNGNIVVVGNQGGVGTMMMLSSTGLPITTFGLTGSVTNGINATSVSVDANNNLYVSIGYLDSDALKKVRIIKMNAAGVLDSSYGDAGMVNAAISGIDNYTSIRLVLDINDKIVVAASIGGSTGQVAMQRFTTSGIADWTQLDISFYVNTNVEVTSLIPLKNGKTLVAGYQYDSAVLDDDDYEFVACIDVNGNLDGEFGSQAIGGLVTFQVATGAQQSRFLWAINIQTNGGILLAGAESPAVDEQVPFTGRLFGFTNIQAVPQFPGYQTTSTIPNILDHYFNGTGIANSGTIAHLTHGGPVAVDSQGRVIVGGDTTDQTMVAVRFTQVGLLDTSFSSDGIALTAVIPNLLQGKYVAVDSLDRVYVSGITNDNKFIVARFLSTGVIDTGFGAVGIAQSASFANLTTGGFIVIDSTDRAVVGGMSSDGKLVVARFTTTGSADSFGAGGITSVSIASLVDGGSVTTNSSNEVFVGGRTSINTLVIAKFSNVGILATGSFGTAGIASTTAITGLSSGGFVGVQAADQKPIVSGSTTNEIFVAARFTILGVADTYGTSGIAYSSPIDGLNSFSAMTIDSQDRTVVGGYNSVSGAVSIDVARFTTSGTLDTVLSTTGMGTTGAISQLTLGGYVATNIFDNIFVGGIDITSPTLIVAELLSGQEIFVPDASKLSPENYKIFYYGNNPNLFEKFLGIDLFARFITDSAAQSATLAAVYGIFDDYVAVYAGQPGWNLLQSTYRVSDQFDAAQATLVITYSSSASQINQFFDLFNTRRAYFYPEWALL